MLHRFLKMFFISAAIFLLGFLHVFASGVDTTFNPGTGANGIVYKILIQPSDGKIIIAGDFTSYNGVTRNRIARINTDGTLDTSFDPGVGADQAIYAMALQPDGKIIIAGKITSYNNISRIGIARINTDGTLDTSFDPGTGTTTSGGQWGFIEAMALQSDGKIIIGGANFVLYNSVSRNGIARINSDGTLDTSFDPGVGVDQRIDTMTLQSNGKIIVGGGFTLYNSVSRNGIARINSDGTLDTSFDPGAGVNGTVYKTLIQSDGKIITVGDFTTYNTTSRVHIARINSDGTLDTSFDPGTGISGPFVNSMDIQSDGQIVIAGDFTGYNGSTRMRLARINSDGTLDTSFNLGSGIDDLPLDLLIQSDGTVLVGGRFALLNGTTRNNIARFFFVPYLATYTAGANGTLTGTTSQFVDPGLNATTVTAVPNTNYAFVNWSDGSTQNPRTDLNVRADIIVTANFSRSAYVFTYTAGLHGTLSGTTPQTVNTGTDGSYVTAVPDAGYRFVNWSDGSTQNPRKDTNASTDLSVTANFIGCEIITVGSFPQFSTAVGTKLYVNNSQASTVSVINTATGTVSSTITVGSHPLTSTLVGTNLYVNNSTGTTVSVIDTTTDTVTATITVGTNPKYSVLVGTKLYVSNNGSSNVSVIDTTTNTVTATLTLGTFPNSLTVVGTKLYVNTGTSIGKVYVIDTTNDTVGTNITVGANPVFSTLVGTSLYVNNSTASTVSVINTGTNTVATTITVGSRPFSSTLVGTKLYVNNSNATTVSVINTSNNTVSSTITVGSFPKFSNLVGTNLYVNNSNATTVSVINTTNDTVSTTITMASKPLTSTLVGTRLYANNNATTTVSTIDTNTNTLVTCATTHTCTYTAGANGTVTGNTVQIVADGQNATAVTAVPATGYSFVNWSDASTQNPRTDTNVTGDITTAANFAIQTKSLSYVAGAHGSISGTTPQTVNYGSDGTAVTAVPDAHYHFVNWSDASTQNPRTDTNVTADATLTANFAIDSYTLTYSAGSHGSLTGSTPQTVSYGSNGTAVTAVPDAGYRFISWSDASTQNPRTDTNITGNISVTANFVVGSHTLTYTASTGGSISGTSPQTVNDGADGTAITAVPDSAHYFSSWSDASTQNPRTDTSVIGDISVTANFTQKDSGTGGGGPITAGSVFGCHDPKATNYDAFSTNDPSRCKYPGTTPTIQTATPTLGGGVQCLPTQILTQNLKSNSRNGKYNSYTKGIVKEAKILQAHLNRLGFSSGSADGILGPKSDGAIKRMQIYLHTKADGYVGPVTRGLINNSCK